MIRQITAAVCVAIISAAPGAKAQSWPERTGPSPLMGGSRDYPRIQRAEEKYGIWGDADDLEWKDAYYDVWRYSGLAGERLTVLVTAKPSVQMLSFSPVVYIYALGPADSLGPIADAQLISWQRAGGYTQNGVSTLLPTDGEYLIVVQPDRPDRSGAYSISVTSSQILATGGEPTPRTGNATMPAAPPSGPPSRCTARTDRTIVEFSCPSGWRRTEWNDTTNKRDAQDQGGGITTIQVNYRDPRDWRINLNVRALDSSIETLWGFGSAVWIDDNFYSRMRGEAYPGASTVASIRLPDTSWRAFSIEIRRDSSRTCNSYPCTIGFKLLGNIVPVDFLLEWRPLSAAPERIQVRDVPDSLYLGLTNEFGALLGNTHAYAVTRRGESHIVIAVTGLDAAEVRERLRQVVESIRIETVP